MTAPLSFSVVVVSHGRPMLLRRALIGISQLFYRPFEIVVVADAEGLAAIDDLPIKNSLKTAEQTRPNISAARNLGVSMAGGDVITFIDDDAVPEPTWLHEFAKSFEDSDLMGATGTVLGRNGISTQWASRIVGADGEAVPYIGGPIPDDMVIKLEGTNMAIRRTALAALGGFDEALSFFLDETDLALRMAGAGMKLGFALNATVHHGYAASTRRSALRVPLSLREIGQSSAVFFRKHMPLADHEPALDRVRSHQRDRIDRLLRDRAITSDKADGLFEGLDEGIRAGMDTEIGVYSNLSNVVEFDAFESDVAEPIVLAGRWFQRKALMGTAKAAVVKNHPVSVFLFEPTIRAHVVEFVEPGIWVQSGGLFGPSIRSERRWKWWVFSRRIAKEISRIDKIRWISRPCAGQIGTMT